MSETPFIEFEDTDDLLPEEDLCTLQELAANYTTEVTHLSRSELLLYLRMPLVPCSIAALTIDFAERMKMIDEKLGIAMNAVNIFFAILKCYNTYMEVARTKDAAYMHARRLREAISNMHERLALLVRESLHPYPEVHTMLQCPEVSANPER